VSHSPLSLVTGVGFIAPDVHRPHGLATSPSEMLSIGQLADVCGVSHLVIGSGDHDRFRFAKVAIARRKEFLGRDVEETVVLAVGEGRSNVHVTRKTRRKARPLWKVTK
jgi:hypothetical protein